MRKNWYPELSLLAVCLGKASRLIAYLALWRHALEEIHHCRIPYVLLRDMKVHPDVCFEGPAAEYMLFAGCNHEITGHAAGFLLKLPEMKHRGSCHF